MKNLTQGNPSTLELALMNLPTGLFISDAAGIIIFINKAYANYLRVRPEDALGRHLSEFFPDSGILRVIASGEPELGALRHIPNSESKILVNRYPLRDAQDRVVGAMAMALLAGRKEDIALLVRHMLARYEGVGCTEAAMRALMAYSWPGNIRELNNAVSHALSLRLHSQIDIGDLPPGIVRNAAEQPTAAAPGKLQSMRKHGEQHALAVALNEYGWNVARAARSLGISRSTMYAKIRALGLRRPR